MFKKGLIFTATALLLGACGATDSDEEVETVDADDEQEERVIKVASHLPPMTDIVEIAGEVIEEPYSVELVEVSDNIQYNEALLNEEVDANFSQHAPYMESFNEERDGNLVAIQPIYNPIVGFYSPVYDSIDEIEQGAEVAIPGDASNEARTLMILDHHDLLTLDPEVKNYEVRLEDIDDNPHDLTFTSMDLLNLSSAYEDNIPLVFNLPTYIEKVGLTPDDALILEDDDLDTFSIQLITREDIEDSDKIKALQKAFTSDEVYEFLEELAEAGHLEPAFEKNE